MRTTLVIKRALERYWWMPMIVGLISLGLGIWTLCEPSSSILVLSYIFAGCLCFAGMFNCIFAVSVSNLYSGWGWSLALGILDLIAGVWLFAMPAAEMETVFVFIVGIWILVVAVNELVQSCMLIKVSPWWILWMILLLIAVIVIAGVFLTNPVEGGVIVWLWLGLSLILFGVYRIVFAARLKTIGHIYSDSVTED